MTYRQDFLSILTGAAALFWANERAVSLSVLAGAFGLAGFCWWACGRYSTLWNKGYRIKLMHHAMCGLAALVTMTAVITFAALKYAEPAARASVGAWQLQILADSSWQQASFAEAYQRVKELGLEDFSKYSAPPAGSTVPLHHDRSRLEFASTYAEGGAGHFKRTRPFLRTVVKARSEVPRERVREDMEHFFANIGDTYPAANAIALVAGEVKAGLEEQLPLVVKSLRLQLAGLFLLGQFIPFGLVGWAACRELKPSV